MKKYKTLTSLLLALTLALTLALPALAAGGTNTGSITVENPLKGEDYYAYKIFDVKAPGGDGSYQYTIAKDSPWLETIATVTPGADEASETIASKIEGLKVEIIPGENAYRVTFTKEGEGKFSASKFAEVLKTELEKTGVTPAKYGGEKLTATADGKMKSGDLEHGYYLVTSGVSTPCSLTTVMSAITVNEKNDVPFEKTVDSQSVEVGQIVTYTIKSKVPNYAGYDTYIYEITDKLSEGLTLEKVESIDIGNRNYLDDKTGVVECTVNNTDNTIKITVDVLKLTAGQDIVITYTAKVNDKAIAVVSPNEATLKFGHDTSSLETREAIEKVYSSTIQILKHELGNEEKTLSGAKFILQNAEGNYYKIEKGAGEGSIEKVTWVSNKEQADVVSTDTDGKASFRGLKDGKYQLIETEAPKGYNKLDGPIDITIDGSKALETADKAAITAALTVTAKVANNNGSVIPSTGGIGTTIFYVVGAVLVVGAGVLLVTKKRMEG